jgi:hypothetical protein
MYTVRIKASAAGSDLKLHETGSALAGRGLFLLNN